MVRVRWPFEKPADLVSQCRTHCIWFLLKTPCLETIDDRDPSRLQPLRNLPAALPPAPLVSAPIFAYRHTFARYDSLIRRRDMTFHSDKVSSFETTFGSDYSTY